jgi:hypothetical protein
MGTGKLTTLALGRSPRILGRSPRSKHVRFKIEIVVEDKDYTKEIFEVIFTDCIVNERIDKLIDLTVTEVSPDDRDN